MSKTTAGVVIIGGGLAGARACMNLRAQDYAGSITLIGDERLLPYDRPPLSKSAIIEEATPEPIWLMDAAIAASLNVDLRIGSAAVRINRVVKTVSCDDGTEIPYTKLLVATGAAPRTLTCPGGEHAVTLRDFSDAIELRTKFQIGKRIVIIGGGFIGLELASSAAKLGCAVTVIEAQSRILQRGVPDPVARLVHARHVAAGVTMEIGTGVAMLAADALTLIDGRVIPADTIVAGIGASPRTALAEAAGLALENGIACNAKLQTSDPDIFAAGDCCSYVHEKFGGKRMRLEAWRNAQEQAATAVENMCGGTKPHTAIPWFWSDQFDLSLQITGVADLGPSTVARVPSEGALILFHMAADGQLMGASGIGPGNSIGRDIKFAEMLIAKGACPPPDLLADPAQSLRALLKG